MENSESSANTTTPYPETLDRKENSLYHLVASREIMWHHAVEGVDLLRKYKVDPTTRNKDGKTPLMMIRLNSDPRYRLIEESVKSFAPDNTKKKNKRRKKKKNNERIAMPTPSKCKKDEEVKQVIPSVEEEPVPPVHCPTEIEILREKISQAIEHFEIKIANETEQSECSEVKETGEIDQNITTNSNEIISPEELIVNTLATENEVVEDKESLPGQSFNVVHENYEEVNDNLVDDDDVCDNMLDNLTWEVECTSEVWKKLKNKKLPCDKKRQIVRIIRQLANGQMRGSRAKRLVIGKESKIRLFEAKLDKSARILWERAIAFSPRCSALSDNKNENGGGIYTEVIRIWDIVFDHDTVPRKIEKIVRSYNRGTSCFIKKNLKGIPVDSSSLSKHNDRDCIPKIYVTREDSDQQVEESKKPCSSTELSKMFFPPGSPEETEYHILKFYEFSNAMVDAMLGNQTKTSFDFPFRVSELEHSVINLAPKRTTSILLLGRSGTGKTTCCLYRLWNNYQTYWQRNTLDEPSIPNVAQFIPRGTDVIPDAESEEEGGNEASVREERSSTSSHDAIEDDQGCSSSSLQQDSRPPMEQGYQESCCQSDEIEGVPAAGSEQTLEHLHQAFITKNAVLCKEVQKNFIELSQACFTAQNHVDNQQSLSVYKFDQLEEQAWPLFICSRDWLLMLDASLPGKPFFPRDEDGKLERSVKGWGEEDNNLQEIPVDYSEDEDEDDEEIESKPTADRELIAEGEADLRREITYQVFKNELWRKMTKKKKVDYHPSLVWTEIISFIKGSVEALHSDSGYITWEEYQTIGKKRASSFTADRETIYELFLAYKRIKRSEGMFDEADVVHNIYHRLEHHVPAWSIHEIYVDETQDFTQAELSVIIRSCRNPNRLFFTGDTAQSIMRGIAFRFSDLRSLFYYMKESVKSVGQEAEVVVPDRVYELTHNYRSHAGILNLASSVTDLLSHFFPESFDKLARDQGLFEGPKPVLLESCSFSDLAVILRGHKRKTSPIEFGAHQVILVASDEVRDSLPEELRLALVMTIYEAKGLEFDDVLIYNFFKDSQVRLSVCKVAQIFRLNSSH
ncbi:TPR and ankyrin repeat-containing 1-like [Paramuricea clavata]|uniref:TPR and ankyrin repeat-containing 1-like n=1 Tax=Paramuricea clavata TaxID=317549 RepID=A0A7D9JG84_PARCT|nr:TPR and ankyrin repeat-containing 1-like [Paramuricea clavata]